VQGSLAQRACDVAVRAAGKAGVALSTLGPGATNFTTSAAYAQLGGFPMLLITGAPLRCRPSGAQPRNKAVPKTPLEVNGVAKTWLYVRACMARASSAHAARAATPGPDALRRGAAGQKPVLKSKQGAFQIVNSVEMFKPLSKFTKQARRPGGPVRGCLRSQECAVRSACRLTGGAASLAPQRRLPGRPALGSCACADHAHARSAAQDRPGGPNHFEASTASSAQLTSSMHSNTLLQTPPQLVDGGLVPAYVREAVRRAEEERPGTSHIELPEDVAHQQARRSRRPRMAFASLSCVTAHYMRLCARPAPPAWQVARPAPQAPGWQRRCATRARCTDMIRVRVVPYPDVARRGRCRSSSAWCTRRTACGGRCPRSRRFGAPWR